MYMCVLYSTSTYIPLYILAEEYLIMSVSHGPVAHTGKLLLSSFWPVTYLSLDYLQNVYSNSNAIRFLSLT